MRADPYDDFAARDAEDAAWLKKRPKCACCDKPIQDEKCFVFGGDFYHIECFVTEYEVDTDDYIK